MLLTAHNGARVDASETAAPKLLAAGWRPVAQDPPQDLTALTAAQLKELCAERGIDAPKRATKAQLAALLGQ